MKETKDIGNSENSEMPIDNIDLAYLLATGAVRRISDRPEPMPSRVLLPPVVLGMDEIDFEKTLRSGQVTPKYDQA